MLGQAVLEDICNWMIKCVVYFVPVLLILARYQSFFFVKKEKIDIIVDGQFCVIPFCMALESMKELLMKWSYASRLARTFLFIGLLIMVLMLLLIYWDLSYVSIQKEDAIVSKDKKMMMYVILSSSFFVVFLSFLIDVVI